ncbi:MAG: hypothetical protein ACM3ML_03440 [Micromonosporaceae bacterium]
MARPVHDGRKAWPRGPRLRRQCPSAERLRRKVTREGIIAAEPTDCVLGAESGYEPGPRYTAAVIEPSEWLFRLRATALRFARGGFNDWQWTSEWPFAVGFLGFTFWNWPPLSESITQR